MREPPPLGAVLAGGKSSRLGRPKALVELGGRTLLERALATVEAAGLEPVVLAREESPLPAGLPAPVVQDPVGSAHPLRAIAGALRERRPLVVTACDMPFAPPALLAWMAGLGDPLAVAECGGRLHPLLGRYAPALAGELAAAADRHEAAIDAVVRLGARRIDEDELRRFGDPATMSFNVNTPEDLAFAHALLGPAG